MLSSLDFIVWGIGRSRKKYLQFISAGGSKYPIDLLRQAGVDMTTAEPFDKTMIVMNRTMDEIEAILEKKAK